MKLCIGITTYNRKNLLQQMASSLMLSNNIEECSLRIYDDNSYEIGHSDLKEIFKNPTEIKIRKNNLGADKNMRQMFIDFLETGDDVLLVADADLIFHPDWYLFYKNHSQYDIISLYNSSSHSPLPSDNPDLVLKHSLGAAGTIFKKAILQEIIDNVPPSRSYDWDWSQFLIKRGYKLHVSKQSYFQHIGLIGTNNDGGSVTDFGINFFPGNSLNEKYLIIFFQTLLISKDDFIRRSFSPKILMRKFRSLAKIISWKFQNRKQ